MARSTLFMFITIVPMFFLILGISEPSYALVDMRVHYGLGKAAPSKLTNSLSNVPVVSSLRGFGADVLADPPLLPVQVGFRYEALGSSDSTIIGSTEYKYDLSVGRLSILGVYRLLNSGIYLGAVATIGLHHSNKMQVSGLSLPSDLKAASVSSYSIGIEAGMKLSGFQIGAEAGYLNMVFKNYNHTITENADFSGIYAKIVAAFSLI